MTLLTWAVDIWINGCTLYPQLIKKCLLENTAQAFTWMLHFTILFTDSWLNFFYSRNGIYKCCFCQVFHSLWTLWAFYQLTILTTQRSTLQRTCSWMHDRFLLSMTWKNSSGKKRHFCFALSPIWQVQRLFWVVISDHCTCITNS